jgi:hypothetical protein
MFIVEERSFGAVLAALALALLIGLGAQMFAPTAAPQPMTTPAAQQRDRGPAQRLAMQPDLPSGHRLMALTLWRG